MTGSHKTSMRIPDNVPRHRAGPTARFGVDAETLARANINPVTGLATDYLNHFNEAIMLLEMLSAMPDCVDDVLTWRPMSYHEHFEASHFRARELAITAYDIADPTARARLDELAEAMNAILEATREALMLQTSQEAAGALAAQAADCLKPLVVRAGAVINGHPISPLQDSETPQAAIDALFAP